MLLVEYCGYVLDQKGYSVQNYIEIFKDYGYKPFILNLHQLRTYNKLAVYNLLFAKES